MSNRLDWWHWLIAVSIIVFGVYTLVTGEWHLRGNPNPLMARVGGGAFVFIGILVVLFGLGWIKQDAD